MVYPNVLMCVKLAIKCVNTHHSVLIYIERQWVCVCLDLQNMEKINLQVKVLILTQIDLPVQPMIFENRLKEMT